MTLARDISTVGGGTMASRALAYARDAGIAALFGASPLSEAFFAVLQLINFFRRLLAEGALNGAFVPVWLDLKAGADSEASANRFTKRVLLAMFCLTGVAALLVNLFAWQIIAAIAPGFDEGRRELATALLRIAAPYVFFVGLIAVLAAALNAERRVAAVTVSTVTFNVVMVATVAALNAANVNPPDKSLLLAGAIVAAAVLQLGITGIAWLATGKRWRRTSARGPTRTGVFFARVVPALVATGIPQLKLIVATAIVSSSSAAVAWFYYANRLYELPLGVASIAVAAVIVPRIAAAVREGSAGETAAQSRALEIALALTLPAAAGLALLATPIAGGLFQRGAFTAADTAAVAATLVAIATGLPGHALEKVFGAVSFAHDDTHTPMAAALCGLATAIGAGLLLFALYGYIGAAAAIALSAWVDAALLGLILRRRGWLKRDAQAAHRLPRILVAAAIMSAVVFGGALLARSLLPHSALGDLAALALLVPAGIAVYLAALQALGVTALAALMVALRT
jgi:putative peptidoglycan lipid II flippase